MINMKHFILFILLSAIFFHVNADTVVHVVQRGESLESIAEKYGVNVQQIKEVNPNMGNLLYAGLKLNIPEGLQERVSNKKTEKREPQDEKQPSNQGLEIKKTTDLSSNSYAATEQSYPDAYNGNANNADNAEIFPIFISVKYDRIGITDFDDSFSGFSVGLLTNPLSDDRKKISYTMQFGAFIDYCQSSNDYIEMHYFGLSLPFHLVGCQFSDGKGNGVSIHGGFEFTWRIDGGGKNKLNDKSFNPFDKDEAGDAQLGHWDAGFAGAIDIVFSKFYASFGYKIFANFVRKDGINAYGPSFTIGYGF